MCGKNSVSKSEKDFEAIAVIGGKEDELTYTTTCGACRQFLSDFGDFRVIIAYEENEKIESKTFTVKELLPENFEL